MTEPTGSSSEPNLAAEIGQQFIGPDAVIGTSTDDPSFRYLIPPLQDTYGGDTPEAAARYALAFYGPAQAAWPENMPPEVRHAAQVLVAEKQRATREAADSLVEEWAVRVTGPVRSPSGQGADVVTTRVVPASIGEEHTARGWLEYRTGNYRRTLAANAKGGSPQARAAAARLDEETYEIITRQATPWRVAP